LNRSFFASFAYGRAGFCAAAVGFLQADRLACPIGTAAWPNCHLNHLNDLATATRRCQAHLQAESKTGFVRQRHDCEFDRYRSKVSPEWKDKVGEGTSVQWPVGLGGKGNEGVAAFVNQTKNSIGYVEYAYVIQNKMTYGLVQNKACKFIKPDAASFQAAAASAKWADATDFYLIMTDAPGDDSYPVAATVFVLMYKQPKDAARTNTTMDFFKWALENGQPQANSLDYVPFPSNVVQQIETYWKTQFAGVKG
jgi:hypothetical protein